MLGSTCCRILMLAWLAVIPSAASAAQTTWDSLRPLSARCWSEHCQKCHGAKKQEAGLRLDSRQALLTGGDNGPAIVPGRPEESLLIGAIRHSGDLQMPPDGKLAEAQVEGLTAWVRQGAAWPASSESPAENVAERSAGIGLFSRLATRLCQQ